jgi:NAD(P) transhydrogenase
MLDMFKRPTDPIEYPWLYAIPAVAFGGGYLVMGGIGPSGYSQVFFRFAIEVAEILWPE